jgi:hypothetical protein
MENNLFFNASKCKVLTITRKKTPIIYEYTLGTEKLTRVSDFQIRVSGPRADGAKRRARVLIPPGYLHPGKRKH